MGQKKNQPIHPPSRRGDDEEEEEEEPVEAGEPEEKEDWTSHLLWILFLAR